MRKGTVVPSRFMKIRDVATGVRDEPPWPAAIDRDDDHYESRCPRYGRDDRAGDRDEFRDHDGPRSSPRPIADRRDES